MTFASILAGQTISDEITQMFSPNAAELGKYGKIPVNHFSEQIKAMLFRHISKIVVTDSHGVRYTFGDDGGTLLGYTVEGLAIDSAATMLSVNYYDDHSFIGSYGFPQDLLFDEAITDDGYGDRLPSAQGTLTGSMSAVITSEGVSAEEFRHTALFYDEYGRAVQTVSRYGDGGMVRTAAAFDFTGNRILSREAVSLSDRCDTVERADAYDLWGRVRGTATGLSAGGDLGLDCVLTDGGRIAAARDTSGNVTAYRALHHLTDHLGSVRAVVDGGTGAVIEASDYYPFGKRIPVTGTVTEPAEAAGEGTVLAVTSASSVTSSNRLRFSGKEDQSCLSANIPLLDFGARMYNPTTVRWTAADPLAENYYGISPYAYCLGNPVIHVDDDGQMPQVVAGALIGAAVGGIMAAVEGKNWREIGGAAVGGAVEGALASMTGGASFCRSYWKIPCTARQSVPSSADL